MSKKERKKIDNYIDIFSVLFFYIILINIYFNIFMFDIYFSY